MGGKVMGVVWCLGWVMYKCMSVVSVVFGLCMWFL